MAAPLLFYKKIGLIRPRKQTVRWEFTPGVEPNEGVFSCDYYALQQFRATQNIPGPLKMIRDNGQEIIIQDLFFRDADLALEDREPVPARNWYSFRLIDKRVLWSYGVVAKRYNVTNGNSGYLSNTLNGSSPYQAFEILRNICAACLNVGDGSSSGRGIQLGFIPIQTIHTKYVNRLQQVIDNVEYECVKPNVAMRDILDRAGMEVGITRSGTVFYWAKQEKKFLGVIDLGTKISGGEKNENMRLFRPKYLDVYFPVDEEVVLEWSSSIQHIQPVVMHDGKGANGTVSAPSGSKDGEWVYINTAATDWGTTRAKMFEYAWKLSTGTTTGKWASGPVTNCTASDAAKAKRRQGLPYFMKAFRVNPTYRDQYLPLRTVTCTIDSNGKRGEPFATGTFWEYVKITGDIGANNLRFKNYSGRIPHKVSVSDAENGIIMFDRQVGHLVNDSKISLDKCDGINDAGSIIYVTVSRAKRRFNSITDYYRFRYDLTTGNWTEGTVAGDSVDKFDIISESAAYSIYASDLTALYKAGVTNDYTNYTALARRALNEKWKYLQMVADVESASYRFAGWHEYDVGPGVTRVGWDFPFPTTDLTLNDTRQIRPGRGKRVTDKQAMDKAEIDKQARRL